MNNDDKERFWNLIIYKIWATNAERDQIFSWLGVIGLIILVIAIVVIVVRAALR